MYETPRKRLSIRKLSYKLPKCAYFNILFKPKNAEFYLTSPDDYTELLENKMRTVWNGSNINMTEGVELTNFDIDKTEICELVLKDYNFKSLNTDKGNLYPLTNMMGILRSLREDDQIRVCIAIEPIKRTNWVTAAKDELKSYKKRYCC
jgi:hypothetical protein